jgi:hypothetical protein
MDATDGPAPHPVGRVDAVEGDAVGVVIANRIVVFNRNGREMSGPIRLEAGETGKRYKVLVTDLSRGSWDVTTASAQERQYAGSENGTVYFEAPGGEIRLVLNTTGLRELRPHSTLPTRGFTQQRYYDLMGRRIEAAAIKRRVSGIVIEEGITGPTVYLRGIRR